MTANRPTPEGAWCVVYTDSGNHVIPNEDLVAHVMTIDCWCVPRDNDGCIVHNSADGREAFERRSWSVYEPTKPRSN